MRSSFFFALTLSILLGGVYWYQAGANQCPVPLGYRIGTLDPRFAIATETAQARVAEAVAVWEGDTGRELFYYDDRARFTVNFIFDERQARENAEANERTQLDTELAENDAVVAQIDRLQNEYESLQGTLERDTTAYENRLAAYNQTVQRYNDQGGAPPDAFAELEAERTALDGKRAALNAAIEEINAMARQINRLADEANVRIERYNEEVASFNEAFADGREFTQGDYQGDRINIYTFEDDVELVTVLAHEFGHALGIGHVEGEASVMYYLMNERSDVPGLSAFDQRAFLAVCGTGQEWQQQLRRSIRELLFSLHKLYSQL